LSKYLPGARVTDRRTQENLMKKFVLLALPASLLLAGCDTGGGAAPIDNAVAVDCDSADISQNQDAAAVCPEGTGNEFAPNDNGERPL
jgi:hypothetical protein